MIGEGDAADEEPGHQLGQVADDDEQGLGRWLINAIRQQDYAAISAGVMVVGSLVILVNVISDILGALANPLKHKEWYALR